MYPVQLARNFAECRLCASVYDDGTKAYLICLAHLVGARITESLTSANTHLLVPRCTGAKWMKAAAFGATAVLGSWLIDSVATGQASQPLPSTKHTCTGTCTHTRMHTHRRGRTVQTYTHTHT